MEYLRFLYENKRLYWETHCKARLLERKISKLDVKNVVMTGKIIKEYQVHPNLKYLVLGKSLKGQNLHVVLVVKEDAILHITAYAPDRGIWKPNLEEKKEKSP